MFQNIKRNFSGTICQKAGDSMKDIILLAGTLLSFGYMFRIMGKVDCLLDRLADEEKVKRQ